MVEAFDDRVFGPPGGQRGILEDVLRDLLRLGLKLIWFDDFGDQPDPKRLLGIDL